MEALALSVKEAARALGISRGSVYALIKKGKLRPVHVGRRCLIPRRALEIFLEAEVEAFAPVAGAPPGQGEPLGERP